mgnify:FL=1
MTWNREPLRVMENGRYLAEGNQPFFWLGDTAWLMLHRLNEEDAVTYLNNRKALGFNVILTVLANSTKGKPVMGNGVKDPARPEYWEFCDRIIKKAEEMGLYLALLPAWGSLVKEGSLTLDNVEAYAEFLGKRYQKSPNLIWILGGDIRGSQGLEIYRKEARVLKAYNPERLISYHPFGRTSSSMWFHQEDWLDFNLFQSGHRRYDQARLGEWDDNSSQEEFFGEDNWRYVERDLGLSPAKPVLDGEPSYEGIPQGLHNPRNGYWEEADARRYAYWSVFAGAAGHTYGNNAIIQFYDGQSGPGAYGVRETWKEALHYPGAGQMQYLKDLMLEVDFSQGRSADELLLYGQKERYHRIAVFAGRRFILCYDYMGDEFLLDLRKYADRTMEIWWMNPQSGARSYGGDIFGQEKWLASPLRRKEGSNDWVLIIKEKEGE